MRPSQHDPERWKQIDAVLDAVLDLPENERPAFLDEACSDDPELRRELDALLHALEQSDDVFGDGPEPGPRVNERIGPFRVVREIGRGGMGVVYLAVDTRLGRKVALKMMPPFLWADDAARGRFMAEARVVSSLDHPNVATLHEINVADDERHYMVFAHYEGQTIAARQESGPIPVFEALRIARDLARGLEAAHARGIVHRDIKPSNVLLTDDGQVKLLDFGVAKVIGVGAPHEDRFLGTVSYMSPEQVAGESVDARTDLWSLGVVLFEMISGTRAYDAETPRAVREAILSGERPDLRAVATHVPDDCFDLVSRLMASDPDDRYAAAADVVSELSDMLEVRMPPAEVADRADGVREALHVTSRSAGRPRLWPVMGLAVLVVASAVWALSGRADPPADRIAVIPLRTADESPRSRAVAVGLQEALTGELGRHGSMTVLARPQMLPADGILPESPEVTLERGADVVVGGEIARREDSLDIVIRLHTAEATEALWSQFTSIGVGDVYVLARETAKRILEVLDAVERRPEQQPEVPPRPVSPAAWEAYVLGQFSLDQRSPDGLQQARIFFARAMEIDSTFAPAYAGMAEAIGSAAFFGLADPATSMPRVQSLVSHALAIDSTILEAYRLQGALNLYWHRDWEAAEVAARRVLAINPSSASGHGLLSEALSVRGRYDEALSAIERSAELNSLVPYSVFRPVVVLYYRREFEEAADRAAQGLDLFPGFWQGHWLMCLSRAALRQYELAIPSCEEAVFLSRGIPMALGGLGYALGASGRHEDALALADELQAVASDRYVGGTNVAMVHAGLDNRDGAFEWLNRAVSQRDVALVHLLDQPVFDGLHGDPRFETLVATLGLPKPHVRRR